MGKNTIEETLKDHYTPGEWVDLWISDSDRLKQAVEFIEEKIKHGWKYYLFAKFDLKTRCAVGRADGDIFEQISFTITEDLDPSVLNKFGK